MSIDIKSALQKGPSFSKAAIAAVISKAIFDTRSYIQVSTGDMRDSVAVEFQHEKGLISYGNRRSAYVRPQYFKSMQHPQGGRDHWFEASKRDNMSSWEHAAKEAVGRVN